jgi:hypothetical protein
MVLIRRAARAANVAFMATPFDNVQSVGVLRRPITVIGAGRGRSAADSGFSGRKRGK